MNVKSAVSTSKYLVSVNRNACTRLFSVKSELEFRVIRLALSSYFQISTIHVDIVCIEVACLSFVVVR